MRSPLIVRATALTCAAVLIVPQLDAAPPDKKNLASASRLVWQYKSLISLGSDAIRLVPSKSVVYFVASAESHEFEKMRLVTEGEKRVKITDNNGAIVTGMPKHLSFRITAGTKDRLTDIQPLPFETQQPLNDFLLGLRFRLKIFRGMEVRAVDPAESRLIGIPADRPYDERIYRTEFEIGEDTRVDDRIVLEVLDAGGKRIMKFHLEMM
jgi:hypothetical protein